MDPAAWTQLKTKWNWHCLWAQWSPVWWHKIHCSSNLPLLRRRLWPQRQTAGGEDWREEKQQESKTVFGLQQMEYLHISLCDSRVYLGQTKGRTVGWSWWIISFTTVKERNRNSGGYSCIFLLVKKISGRIFPFITFFLVFLFIQLNTKLACESCCFMQDFGWSGIETAVGFMRYEGLLSSWLAYSATQRRYASFCRPFPLGI